ncbi:MAG: cytidine deaminase [Deltaproteobacteria bacterium CG2_30_63_29]|nr:MAG: cytidine deaminase [Deltaproteobacteria bacterium CG2_30_63_29]PJB41561.1 MAG: cytidine deaminase [Deltaproteobacteria bacterium CG_4_9_14_3_um_filter_63_12]
MTQAGSIRTITLDSLDPSALELVRHAQRARANAYAPYSRFRVGAAVRTASGDVYVGCNVENGSFGATVCAERNAVGAAIAAGEREITTVAVTATADEICPPCGICRQVLSEFGPEMRVLLVTESEEIAEVSLSTLLPVRFRSEIFLHKEKEG